MSDNLPVNIGGDDSSGGDESWGIFEWLLAAGGVVAVIYLLAWVFDILVWLTGYALQAAVAVLVLYAIYKGIEYMLGGESSERQTTVPESEVQGELDDLSAGGDIEAEFGDLDEVDSRETSDVKMGNLPEQEDPEVDLTTHVQEDDLEEKFAELEEEMSEDN